MNVNSRYEFPEVKSVPGGFWKLWKNRLAWDRRCDHNLRKKLAFKNATYFLTLSRINWAYWHQLFGAILRHNEELCAQNGNFLTSISGVRLSQYYHYWSHDLFLPHQVTSPMILSQRHRIHPWLHRLAYQKAVISFFTFPPGACII